MEGYPHSPRTNAFGADCSLPVYRRLGWHPGTWYRFNPQDLSYLRTDRQPAFPMKLDFRLPKKRPKSSLGVPPVFTDADRQQAARQLAAALAPHLTAGVRGRPHDSLFPYEWTGHLVVLTLAERARVRELVFTLLDQTKDPSLIRVLGELRRITDPI